MTAPLELPEAVVRETVPDDDIVLGYVTRGTMARYVEGVAAVNAAFREELEACIDGLEEAGEAISPSARAWRMPSAVVMPLEPSRPRGSLLRYSPVALAAAIFLVAGGAFLHSEREAERVQTLKDQEIAAKQAQVDRLVEELKAQQEAMHIAQAEFVSAKNEADRAAAQSKIVAAQEEQRKTQANLASARGAKAAGPRSTAKAACNCQPGDPLCSCL